MGGMKSYHGFQGILHVSHSTAFFCMGMSVAWLLDGGGVWRQVSEFLAASLGPVLAPGLQHGSGPVCWYSRMYVELHVACILFCRYGTKTASGVSRG